MTLQKHENLQEPLARGMSSSSDSGFQQSPIIVVVGNSHSRARLQTCFKPTHTEVQKDLSLCRSRSLRY